MSDKPTDLRWRAVVTYRSIKLGQIDVEHFFEEIEDLHDIIERGPDWNAIERIDVTLNRKASYSTIEEASAA